MTCYCESGQVYCQAQMCATHCTHPKKVPGQCCPVCDGKLTPHFIIVPLKLYLKKIALGELWPATSILISPSFSVENY